MKSALVVMVAATAVWGQSVYSGTWSSKGAATYGSTVGMNVYVAPGGSDSNPCTLLQPCLTPQHASSLVRGMPSGSHVVTLRGGTYALTAPWALNSGDSGNAATPVVYQNYAGEIPVISGGRKVAGVWIPDVTVNCGANCSAYYQVLDANPSHSGHYENFESLFYNGVRRPRPQKRSANGGYLSNACPGTNTAPMCVAGANQAAADTACGCPAGSGPCSFQSTPCTGSTPWMCFNKFMYSGSDIDGTWHAINIGDVELLNFERWTMSRLRLLSASAGTALFTGPDSFSNGDNGCLPGNAYILENVKEQAAKGQWYLDRCPTGCSGGVPETTWRLNIYADTSVGENPLTADVEVPLFNPTTLVSASNLSYVTFKGITFQTDNWLPGQYGLGDSSGMPAIPGALSFTNSSNLVFDGVTVAHVQGWAMDFQGASNNNQIINSAIYDVGAGGIRFGAKASSNDTDTNVPSGELVQNTVVAGIGRIQPTGEGPGVSLGDVHDSILTHNDIYGTYSGCINLGYGLNRGPADGSSSTQFFTYNNTVSWNHCYGQGQGSLFNGVLSDFGGIHAASSLSANCPTTGQPSLGPPNTYCNHILYNKIHDLVHNYDNTNTQGAQGIYLDQGTSNMETRFNLVYRVSHTCAFNAVADIQGPNVFAAQWNLWENNIWAGCGAQQSNNPRVLNRGGSNGNSLIWRKNIGYYNSAVGANPQSSPGHWGCFADDGVTVVACNTRFDLNNNLWWNAASGNTLSFSTCKTSACAGWPANFNQYSTLPWSGEDTGSTTTDPLFVNPAFGVDDWHFQADLSGIGFVAWDYTQAGRTNATIAVPSNIPDLFPLRAVDAHNDYGVPPVGCGPPLYPCSRTDLIAAPAPTAPNVGNLTGAGSCFNDPDFGSKVCRMTDSQTLPSPTSLVAGSGGSGDQSPFNTNSTKLMIDSIGGITFPMNFNPTTMTVTRMYGNWSLSTSGIWSYTNPDVFYGLAPTGTAYLKYDTSSPSIPVPTTVADFNVAGCLGGNFTATWNTDGGVSKDDTVFSAGFSNSGGQGGAGALYVAALKVGSGCQMLNTSNGVITTTGVWAPSGTVPGWAGLTDADGFTVHNVKMAKSGDWLTITPTLSSCLNNWCNGVVFFWQIGTLNVFKVSNQASGHFTEGYSHWINAAGAFGNYKIRSFATPTTTTTILPATPPGLVPVYDVHMGWPNVDVGETVPFLTTSYTTNSPVPNVAWYNEVDAVSPVNGTVWRFAHTFITALSHRFNDQQAIGAASQDARFYMWSSDWMGTLGSEAGASTCTVGTDCRGDVFIVELK